MQFHSCKGPLQILLVEYAYLALHHHVINIIFDCIANHIYKQLVDHALVGGACVDKPERHPRVVMIYVIVCIEDHVWHIPFIHPGVVVVRECRHKT